MKEDYEPDEMRYRVLNYICENVKWSKCTFNVKYAAVGNRLFKYVDGKFVECKLEDED